MMSVVLTNTPKFSAALPRKLFDTGIAHLTGSADSNQYAVAGHGERFLINRSSGLNVPPPLVVVTNWSGTRH